MDFTLTEEQSELQALARRVFTERATTARVEAVEATVERFDRDLWRELAATGLLGVALPEEHDGLGLGTVEVALVAEQLGRVVAPVPYVWTAAAAGALAETGDEPARHWLPGVGTGDVVLGFAPPPSTTGVRLAGDRLGGTLVGVPYAHVAAALVVPLPDALVLVDLAHPGVSVQPAVMTTRELAGQVALDDVPALRLGGADAAERAGWRLGVLLAAVQAGVTDAAVRMAAEYTSHRQQFGRPLSSFQGVSHKAADAFIDATAIRASMLQAAWRLDRDADPALAVLTAAWWAADAGQHCVHLTQHIHGGIGADVTYPVHRYFLWAKQIELLLGGASATAARLGDVLAGADAPGDELVLPVG